jgi:hypothetical protein
MPPSALGEKRFRVWNIICLISPLTAVFAIALGYFGVSLGNGNFNEYLPFTPYVIWAVINWFSLGLAYGLLSGQKSGQNVQRFHRAFMISAVLVVVTSLALASVALLSAPPPLTGGNA